MCVCVRGEGDVEGNVATSDSAELFVTRRLESLHLTINLESGALLPLALRWVDHLSFLLEPISCLKAPLWMSV